MYEIRKNQPAEEYFSADALNKSSIDLLLECPALYKARHDGAEEPSSKAFILGSLLHCMVLEPEAVAERYARVQNPGTTKAGKEERKNLAEEGIAPISAEDWACAEGMTLALHANPTAGKLLSLPGERELSVYWDEDFGGEKLPCKCRVDRLARVGDVSIAIDVKTTADTVKPAELARKSYAFGYHRQAAWYLRGLKAHGINATFVFLFVSKQEPHLVTPLAFNASSIGLGDKQCERAARVLLDCQKKGEWPCYVQGITTIDLPEWAFRQAEDEMEAAQN